MGIEVEKVANGTRTPAELAEMQRLNAAQRIKAQTNAIKANEKDKKAVPDAHLDIYRRQAVSETIEQQIKQQEAKIKELSKNLEGLREDYAETAKAEDEARAERYAKQLAQHQKEVTERSLKRIFADWREKFLRDKEDTTIKRYYHSANGNYENAIDERKLAEKAYDIADAAAFDAISKHNKADAQYLGALWVQQDAYWDLAHMQRRLGIAKLREKMFK